jgi:hypothetical protein
LLAVTKTEILHLSLARFRLLGQVWHSVSLASFAAATILQHLENFHQTFFFALSKERVFYWLDSRLAARAGKPPTNRSRTFSLILREPAEHFQVSAKRA